MLKSIQLSIVERRLLSALLNGLKSGDAPTAKNIREIRRRLDLRLADHVIEGLNELTEEFTQKISWESFADPDEVISEFQELLEKADPSDASKLQKVLDALKEVLVYKEFTMDEVYLNWLKTVANEKDWSKVNVQQRDGSVTEQQIVPSYGILMIFADTLEALDNAKFVEKG